MKRWLPLLLAISAPSFANEQCEPTLDQFFDQLSAAAQQGDKERYVGLFQPEASIFVPHSPPLVGREEIGAWFDDFRETMVQVVKSYEQEKVDTSAAVALVRSRATGHYLVKATNEKIPFDQKYLDVLRCEDGDWRMAYHVASSSTLEPGLWDRGWKGASEGTTQGSSAAP